MLGDFNARVGRSVQIADVIGMFGKDTCNASGNKLLSFLNEVELMLLVENLCLSLSGQGLGIYYSLKQK